MTVDAFLDAIHRLKVSCEMLGLQHPPMITLATAREGIAIETALRARIPTVAGSPVVPDTKPMRMFHIDGVPVQYPTPTESMMAVHDRQIGEIVHFFSPRRSY